jgi:heme-degrading monooxygenase HmoA
MFIAMNRFRVAKGSEGAFEQVWLSRDSHLDKVPGFVEFHLLKGPEAEDHTLYASHTVWENRANFEAWTKSEAFRAAHSRAGDNKPLYLDHPQFEGFEVRQTVGRGKAGVDCCKMARVTLAVPLRPIRTPAVRVPTLTRYRCRLLHS